MSNSSVSSVAFLSLTCVFEDKLHIPIQFSDCSLILDTEKFDVVWGKLIPNMFKTWSCFDEKLCHSVTFGQAVWYLLEIFVCIYAKNFTENRCGVSDNQLVLSFHKDIILSARIFIHFHLVIDYRVYSIFHKQDGLVILKETTSFLLFFVLRMLYFVKMSM